MKSIGVSTVDYLWMIESTEDVAGWRLRNWAGCQAVAQKPRLETGICGMSEENESELCSRSSKLILQPMLALCYCGIQRSEEEKPKQV